MNAETLRDLLNRRPFEPFELRLTSGEQHQVRHPENAMLVGARLVLAYPETERIVILSLLHVASIEMLQAAA